MTKQGNECWQGCRDLPGHQVSGAEEDYCQKASTEAEDLPDDTVDLAKKGMGDQWEVHQEYEADFQE